MSFCVNGGKDFYKKRAFVGGLPFALDAGTNMSELYSV